MILNYGSTARIVSAEESDLKITGAEFYSNDIIEKESLTLSPELTSEPKQIHTTQNTNATSNYTSSQVTPHFSDSDLRYLIDARYTTIVLCILTAYLLIAAVTYEVRKQGNRTKRVVGGLIIAAAAAALFSCCWQMAELWSCCIIPCHVFKGLYGFAYVINSSSVYTIIWFHQRKLYSDPRLSESKSKCLKLLNIAVLVAVQLVIVLVVIGLLNGYSLYKTAYGCVLIWKDGTLYTVLIPVTAASMTFTILFRGALLFLIIYPLLRRIKRIDIITNKELIKCKLDISKDIQRLVNRLGLCTFFALLLKILLDILSLLEALQHINVFVSNLRVLELILQSFLINFTFANWKHRLFPFIKRDSLVWTSQ